MQNLRKAGLVIFVTEGNFTRKVLGHNFTSKQPLNNSAVPYSLVGKESFNYWS